MMPVIAICTFAWVSASKSKPKKEPSEATKAIATPQLILLCQADFTGTTTCTGVIGMSLTPVICHDGSVSTDQPAKVCLIKGAAVAVIHNASIEGVLSP